MTNSVTFPVNLGGDGSTVTDDDNASTGLGNGGHRTRFVPAMGQVVAVANVLTQRLATQSDTSTTSTAIASGSKSFTTAGFYDWVVGMYVVVASASNPTNLMYGQVTSWSTATNVLVVNVASVNGSGTYADWTLSLSGPPSSSLTPNETGYLVATSVYPSIRPSLLLDFANTQTLDPRITFTRASTATYYDGSTALAEQNLLVYSQNFSNSAWGLTSAVVTANATTAPDNTTTAAVLTASAANASIVQAQAATSGLQYTFSVWIKRKTGTGVVDIACQSGLGYQTVAVDGTWQRFTLTRTVTATSAACYIRLQTSGDEVYIWGAQLEQRSAVTAYTATTTAPISNYIPVLKTASANQPRFSVNPTTEESLGFLSEQQSTNLCLYSQDSTGWSPSPGGYLSAATAQTIAPDGTLTAVSVTTASLFTSHGPVWYKVFSGAVSTTYCGSLFLKAGAYSRATVAFENTSFPITTGALFDLAAGTVVTTAGTTTATITPVGNGWYRCSVTATSAATSGGYVFGFHPAPASVTTVNGSYTPASVGLGIYYWGGQVEVGAAPTSYIPTTSSQVTRAADSAVMTGTNFSSWYNQGQGTVTIEGTFTPTTSSVTYPSVVTVGGANTGMDSLGIYFETGTANTGKAMAGFKTNGVSQVSSFPVPSAVNSWKAAFSFSPTSTSTASNGVVTSTSGTYILPTATQLLIMGTSNYQPQPTGTVKRISYYPIALTSAQVQAITTV